MSAADFTLRVQRNYQGFLSIDEVHYEYARLDGTKSGPQRAEVMQRGDAAAMLVYDRDADAFILAKQFRIATALESLPGRGWLLELPAGGIGHDESPLACARRECFEETGYQVEVAQHIATVYASPGGSSERLFIYAAVVGANDKKGTGGGVGDEYVLPVPYGRDEFFEHLKRGEFQDAKLVIAGQWAMANKDFLDADVAVTAARSIQYRFKQTRSGGHHADPIIGILVGDIKEMHDIDVWVNSENTDMLMARFFEKSISANIRYLGAEKHRGGIYRDTIADELRSKLRGSIFVRPGSVVESGPGELAKPPHRVRAVLHAAAVQGLPGRGLFADAAISVECLNEALATVDRWNRWPARWWRKKPYRSILIPMLGAGTGGADIGKIAPALADAAVKYVRDNPKTTLEQIYLLAFKAREVRVLKQKLDSHLTGLLIRA